MKNLKRESDNSFSWKINASALLKNLDRIMEGIEPGDKKGWRLQDFLFIFLKANIQNIFPKVILIKSGNSFPLLNLLLSPAQGTGFMQIIRKHSKNAF